MGQLLSDQKLCPPVTALRGQKTIEKHLLKVTETANQLGNVKYLEKCTQWLQNIWTGMMGEDKEDQRKTLKALLGNEAETMNKQKLWACMK